MLSGERRQDRRIGVVIEVLERGVVRHVHDVRAVGDKLLDLVPYPVADEHGRELGLPLVRELSALAQKLERHARDIAFMLFGEDPYAFIRGEIRGPALTGLLLALDGLEFAGLNAGPADRAALG